MSSSPLLRRLSTSTSNSANAADTREELINAYEAEEERIINVLSRKLEKLREEKITLENALEAESESHVNRLNRELSLLRARQMELEASSSTTQPQPQPQQNLSIASNVSLDPRFPNVGAMLEAMRKENESLRSRLVDTERDYVRITRLNDVYREELIEHRRRLGLPVDNLIGLSASDPFSQPLHRRSTSVSRSPTTSIHPHAAAVPHRPALPIPRNGIGIGGHHNNHRSDTSTTTVEDISLTPPSTSPSSASSGLTPFPFSPTTAHSNVIGNGNGMANGSSAGGGISIIPASYTTQSSLATSYTTNITTPPSSASLHATPPPPYPSTAPLGLTYPSVPPPSLSSSLGSPVVSVSQSPVESRMVRGPRQVEQQQQQQQQSPGQQHQSSNGREARVAETGNLRDLSRSRSRRGSTATPSSSVAPGESGSPVALRNGMTLEGAAGVSNGTGSGRRASSSHRIAETGSLGGTRNVDT